MQECRSIITKCIVCQKAFKKPLEQKMGILPKMRVTPNPPFKEVGLDLMGPFGVVFACMSSRSVHVEIVLQMDAQSLLNAITRYDSLCIKQWDKFDSRKQGLEKESPRMER